MVSAAYREQSELMTVAEARQAEGEDSHRMVIAANERSRMGDEVNLRGIRFTNYMKNPVVLWAHGASGMHSSGPSGGIPIARTLSIGHDDQGRIVADFQFNSGDTFASRVENAWNGGFIRGASIRYVPIKVTEVRGRRGEVTRLRIEESELVEWSLVPVPADPDSVRAAARALNLPEEIFRGLEPEPEESEPPPDPVTDEPEPEPKQGDPVEALRERVDTLEQELRALAAKPATTEEEPQETPTPDEPKDPVLVAVEAEFAAMRQIIEEK